MKRVTPSDIMELLKTAGAGSYISFASGLPDPALFPVDELRLASDHVLSTDGGAALQYGPAEGYPPLREWIAKRLNNRGLRVKEKNILITNGSQQALDLAARVYLNDGDAVCIENPTYLAALQIFDSCAAEYRTVSQDDDGMIVDDVERSLSTDCKLLFALPNFQNPTGRTLSAERRKQLAAILDRSGTVLLEDDAYHDLCYDGPTLPPISSLTTIADTLYSSTFSKSIAPGLRVGYLCGPEHVISRLTQLKQIADLHTGSLTQRIVHWYVTEYDLDAQIEKLRAVYRSKRDVMLSALARSMPESVRWTRPAGGMFLWMTLPESIDGRALLGDAMSQGVMFVPGSGFHQNQQGSNTIRLNFVSAPADQIVSGISILAKLIKSRC